MSKSLKIHLIFRFSLILALILILFVVGFDYLSNQSQSNKILAQMREIALESEAKLLSQNSLPRGEISIDLPKNSAVALIKDDKIIAKSRDYNHTVCQELANSSEEFLLKGYEYLTACYWERFNEPFNGAVVLQKSGIENESEDAREILLTILIPVAILLLFVAWRLIDRIIKPIEMMTEAIRQVRVDNFSRTIPTVAEYNEIKALTDAYNEMILRLREGVATLEEFNSNIAHELRTPLSVMLGEVELALRKDRDISEYKKALERVHIEAKYLQKMIESLLLLGRYTKDNIKDSFKDCRLDILVLDILDRFASKIKDKELTVNSNIQAPIKFRCNETLIRAMISNIIDNAIKYSPNHSQIDISLQKIDNSISFEVRDRGEGVSQDKLNKLTKRFYRVDDARSRQTEGVGLGLAIVEKAVKLHNGRLEFDSKEQSGLRVRVYFDI